MNKTEQCEFPPIYRYTWPGKDEDFICFQHSTILTQMAQAIGFHIQLIPLNGWQEQAKYKCNQQVKVENVEV